jgi:DNA transformation protein
MDARDLEELFAPIGAVTVKSMFGGKAVYLDGHIFAIWLRGDLYLKGDAASAPALEAAGGRRWIYEGSARSGADKQVAMPYWTMPDVCFDDEEELLRFVRQALEASRRIDAGKPKKGAKKPKKASRTAGL